MASEYLLAYFIPVTLPFENTRVLNERALGAEGKEHSQELEYSSNGICGLILAITDNFEGLISTLNLAVV
ncbi:hypothetical protein K443DRAFT_10003 [Laccaria amethystina LaAM-08-1]|uniref:Uncharacterized protein n=1 Tax=Laccaria amethystina LaAM-08-1 TaxID=1095629 RepID=A0A0C9WLI8_9AGAR|nr:hypothetical protein K443DRAFT_10003 [Laccaria amethystina LaAM-08-1]